MKNVFARVDTKTTPLMAKTTGEQAGTAAAARYRGDPSCFEETPNPFGMDSEPQLWEAWQDAYEEWFEINK
ncbi:MAG: hypothetical protein ABSC03_09920 [Verrucomicrobiota bacterium]|jgi:hypothetical protein